MALLNQVEPQPGKNPVRWSQPEPAMAPPKYFARAHELNRFSFKKMPQSSWLSQKGFFSGNSLSSSPRQSVLHIASLVYGSHGIHF